VNRGFKGFKSDDAEFLKPSQSGGDQYDVSARGRGSDNSGFKKGYGAYSDDSADFLNRAETNFHFLDHRDGGVADISVNVERNQLQDASGGKTGPISFGVGGDSAPRYKPKTGDANRNRKF